MSSNPPTEAPARRPWSLRARLVAAMLALLGLSCLAVGVLTGLILRHALYDRIDAQLTAAADRSPRGFEGLPDPFPPQQRPCADTRPLGFPPGQQIGTLAARVCGGTVSTQVLAERGVPGPDVPADAAARLAALPTGAAPRTIGLGAALGDYRVVAQPLPDGSLLVTGLPLRDTQDTLYLVAVAVAGVTVLALAAVGVGGTIVVRRTLRPLARVAATAGRVAELKLDTGAVDLAQRVPEADTDPRTEVGQVGAALNRMLDHVGAALQARHASEQRVRRFVADASHELRTPLAAIRGYAELGRRGGDPARAAHLLHRVEAAARRMTTLVEDLLLLARLDAGRPLEHRPVDLSALVVDAIGDAHAAGPGHDWRLDLPGEPVTVLGDPARLHQVLANLLANARTHTPERTTVTVGVRADGDAAVLTVADDGPGIPAELLPHVFERFARGDSSRSRAAGSTGLGLSIVDAVVGAHGGSAGVDSAPGRTVFTVRLPAVPPAAEPATGEPSADRDVPVGP